MEIGREKKGLILSGLYSCFYFFNDILAAFLSPCFLDVRKRSKYGWNSILLYSPKAIIA